MIRGNKRELVNMLRIYPIVWVIGEPADSYSIAAEALSSISEEAQSVSYWNLATGIGTDWGRQPKPPIQSEQDLLTGLLNVPLLAVLVEGCKLGAHVQAAAISVIKEDRRVVFVASHEPPKDFLPDYIQVFEIEFPSEKLREDINSFCASNEKEFSEDYISPLTGLRPFRAGSIILESFAFAQDDDRVAYLYSSRSRAISSDSEGVITLEDPEENFKSLVGLTRAKTLLDALGKQVQQGVNVRGAMLLGVPGTGKTVLARATAGELHLPLYVTDVGATFGSLVGETERKSRRAIDVYRRSPKGVILFDELEKAFASTSQSASRGDSGVGARSGSYFLKYLENPEAIDGYHLILATSNDVLSLPQEYTRAGRWDALFWFGLPSTSALRTVLNMYRQKFDLPKAFGKGAKLKGMTPAEVESCCRVAARLGVSSWDESVQFVPRLSMFRAEELDSMRTWAVGRCVSADKDDPLKKFQATSTARKVRDSASKLGDDISDIEALDDNEDSE